MLLCLPVKVCKDYLALKHQGPPSALRADRHTGAFECVLPRPSAVTAGNEGV